MQTYKIFGKPVPSTMPNVEQVLIEESIGHPILENCKIFHKFIYKKVAFHSISYNRLKKRNNSTIMTNDGELLTITGLCQVKLRDIDEKMYIVMGKIFQNTGETMFRQGEFDARTHSLIVIPTDNSICCELHEIQRKCVNSPYIGNRRCITPLVNRLETD